MHWIYLQKIGEVVYCAGFNRHFPKAEVGFERGLQEQKVFASGPPS